MDEGPVGLRHAVRIFAALYGRALPAGGVEQLARQLLRHGPDATSAGRPDEPAHGERGAPLGADVDWHLIGGAADAPGLDLDSGRGVAQRLVEDVDRRSP